MRGTQKPLNILSLISHENLKTWLLSQENLRLGSWGAEKTISHGQATWESIGSVLGQTTGLPDRKAGAWHGGLGGRVAVVRHMCNRGWRRSAWRGPLRSQPSC